MDDSYKLLLKAYKNKYAIPQFNIVGEVYARYILEECQRQSSPVILGVSEKAAEHMGGFKAVKYSIDGLIESLNIKIPVILHLDHSKSVEACEKAIKAGFDSVMLDFSSKDISENIKATRSLTKKYYYTMIESEIGMIGKEGNKGIIYTEVKDAVELSNKSKCHILAVSIGTVHGPYKGKPVLNIERLKEINKELNKPLVMHGGSGLSDEQFIGAIKSGMAKININTELKKAWTKGLREALLNKDEYDPVVIEKNCEKYIKEVVSHFVEVFGSKGRA